MKRCVTDPERDMMGVLQVTCLTRGLLATNCYFLTNTQTGETLIVDPPDNGDRLVEKCISSGFKPVAVLLTHGHCDHVMGVPGVRRSAQIHNLEIPVYAYEDEVDLLEDPNKNLSAGFGFGSFSLKVDHTFTDLEMVTLAGMRFQVIHTPGHTPGGCCFYFAEDGVLISGDTLFHQSVGRTDFPGGDTRELVESIVTRLYTLPDETVCYPGHMDSTTIGSEKLYNPVRPDGTY